MTVRVIGPRECSPNQIPPEVINTTSRSKTWSRGLSPFFVGPVPLYDGAPVAEAANMENAWQFSKVYEEHLGPGNRPAPAYFKWAVEGWQDPQAHRYPKGRGRKPVFSWWAGQALSYVEARKSIYVPLYGRAVARTEAFGRLLALYRERGEVTLWDFDGYDHHALGRTFREVVNDPDRKMGHAFVLAGLLEGLTTR